MMKLFPSILIACLWMVNQSNAQQSPVQMTLAQAQEYAMKNAFQIKSSGYDAVIAKLNTDALLGLGMPQVQASLQYNNYINLPTSLVPAQFFGGAPGEYAKVRFGVPQNMSVGISATQLLFSGTWLVGIEASKAYAAFQQQNIKRSEVQVREMVASAYQIAQLSHENVRLLQESRAVTQKLLEDTRLMNVNGFVESQDAEQLELALNNIQIKINEAEQQVDVVHDVLKFSMGMPIETELVLMDPIQAMLDDTSLELLSSPLDIEANVDVTLAREGLLLRNIAVKAEKSRFLPTAALFYNLQTQAQRDQFDFWDTKQPWFPIQLWGVQVSAPIFSGFTKQKNLEIAKVQVQQTTDLLNYTREAKKLEYAKSAQEFKTAYETMQASKSSLELSNRILKKTRIKYNEGISTSFEITQLQRQAIEAQGQYVRAMFQVLNARIAMLKILNKI